MYQYLHSCFSVVVFVEYEYCTNIEGVIEALSRYANTGICFKLIFMSCCILKNWPRACKEIYYFMVLLEFETKSIYCKLLPLLVFLYGCCNNLVESSLQFTTKLENCSQVHFCANLLSSCFNNKVEAVFSWPSHRNVLASPLRYLKNGFDPFNFRQLPNAT